MTSNVDPTKIDPTLPAPSPAVGQSQDLRDNLAAIQENDGATKSEIEAITATPAGGWRFEAGGTGSAPSSGAMRINAASLAGTTAIRVHDTNVDGRDVAALMLSLRAGDFLHVQARDGSAAWALYSVDATPTDNANDVELAVTGLGGAGNWAMLEYQIDPVYTARAALVGVNDYGAGGDICTPHVVDVTGGAAWAVDFTQGRYVHFTTTGAATLTINAEAAGNESVMYARVSADITLQQGAGVLMNLSEDPGPASPRGILIEVTNGVTSVQIGSALVP